MGGLERRCKLNKTGWCVILVFSGSVEEQAHTAGIYRYLQSIDLLDEKTGTKTGALRGQICTYVSVMSGTGTMSQQHVMEKKWRLHAWRPFF
jgi:hypothetical protein